MKVEIDEELWYGVNSDDRAEGLAAKSMSARMGRIIGAKPFPAAAHRLSQLTQNPNCQMDDVVGVLESDPALSARVLRLVNSVGFSLRTACTSVRHAATLVGIEKLNQVASTAAILDMYESGSAETTRLLEHATVVGTLCRYLGFHFGLQPDELFTCGFLHDIGKLMLLDTEGEEYLELLRQEDQFDSLFIEERKQFGFDHALLAGHVLAAWHIPHPVPKVVAWHHHVTRAYAESTEISQLVSTVRLADAMSYALERPDVAGQIQSLAKTEAASYMDISEGQLAAMWEEVRALTRRAKAVFRGEQVDEIEATHTSRPSAASLRAVAKVKQREQPRILTTSIAPPALSERPRQFPCVVCDAPSYAHRCSACHGYVCPLHMGKEDEWCQLCQKAYREEGIPQIRPALSTLLGATLGGLLAAAFFGAASAGAQRPMKLMLGPTLILMLLGTLLGVGHRWVRRWWFLRSRPNRASLRPRSVEAVLDSALKQSPEIREVGTSRDPPARPSTGSAETALSLSQPHFPAPPGVPSVEASNHAASFAPAAAAAAPASAERDTEPPEYSSASERSERPSEPLLAERPSEPSYGERRSDVPAHRPSRPTPPHERHWMSNVARTPRPTSELPAELAASLPPASAYEESLTERREAPRSDVPGAARVVAVSPARSAVSVSAELTSSILALEQALSDAPAPLAGASGASLPAPKSSRRPSRRAARAPSVAAARSSRTPSHAPPAPVSRTPSHAPPALVSRAPSVAATALAAAVPAVLAPEADAVAAAAPKSAVLPIAASQPPVAAPDSGWKDVLDLHGTASGW